MRRHNPLFNGNPYVLNKNTSEIHDLDNESFYCQIDKIKPEHVMNCMSYEDAWLCAKLLECPDPNGCHYCLPSKDNG